MHLSERRFFFVLDKCILLLTDDVYNSFNRFGTTDRPKEYKIFQLHLDNEIQIKNLKRYFFNRFTV